MKRARAMVAVAGLTVASGCAFTDVPVTLPTTMTTGLSGGEGRQIVVLSPFKDERARRDRCGIQKNSYNAETAAALCSMEPAKWMGDMLASQLKAAGFSVVEGGAAKPGALEINGTLTKFFVEPVPGFSSITLETDVQAQLVVRSKTGLVAERTFFTKAVTQAMVSRAGNFQTSVDEATQTIVKDMVAAVITLANRYPQLGGRPPVIVVGSMQRERAAP
ncbi:MAG: YajG family lipoprotein [Pirellulales bacterium]